MLYLTNLAKQKKPRIHWQEVANETLGKNYDLSVVLASNALMKKLNRTYRNKNKTASVLSFPLSKKEGEIFINATQKRHQPLSLFIHALLHLKGLKHSAKMEEQEKKLMKKYGNPQYSNRHRRRNK